MSNFIAPTSQRALDEAKQKGLEVVFPGENELQIDIDDEAALKTYTAHEDIIENHWGIKRATKEASKSGKPGKYHITVTLKKRISPLERIALQMALGSDRKREVLSLVQLNNGDPNPTLFLETPGRKFREE